MTNYRQVGGRVGAHIRSRNPSIQQIQAVLADLLAGDSLLPTMRDVVSHPSFGQLQALAGSGGGFVQRDALLQDLKARYLPEVVHKVSEFISGMLDLSVHERSDKAVNSPKQDRTDLASTALMPVDIPTPKNPALQQERSDQSTSPSKGIQPISSSEGLTDQTKNTQIAAAVISLAVAGIGAAIIAGISSTQSSSQNSPPATSQTNGDSYKNASNESQQGEPLTAITGEVTYPGTGIPPIRICAVEISTSHEICKPMPESPVKYQYKLNVPAGTYNVFYETLDRRLRFWNGACSDSGNLCGDYIVNKLTADPSITSITADLGDSDGLQSNDGTNAANFIF